MFVVYRDILHNKQYERLLIFLIKLSKFLANWTIDVSDGNVVLIKGYTTLIRFIFRNKVF
jgi:hypothetical protein